MYRYKYKPMQTVARPAEEMMHIYLHSTCCTHFYTQLNMFCVYNTSSRLRRIALFLSLLLVL